MGKLEQRLNEPQREQLNIAVIMQRAFDCMMNENLLELSEKGKEHLDKCWEESSKDKWRIDSINVFNTLDIYSDGRMIYRYAPLDWFVWRCITNF